MECQSLRRTHSLILCDLLCFRHVDFVFIQMLLQLFSRSVVVRMLYHRMNCSTQPSCPSPSPDYSDNRIDQCGWGWHKSCARDQEMSQEVHPCSVMGFGDSYLVIWLLIFQKLGYLKMVPMLLYFNKFIRSLPCNTQLFHGGIHVLILCRSPVLQILQVNHLYQVVNNVTRKQEEGWESGKKGCWLSSSFCF